MSCPDLRPVVPDLPAPTAVALTLGGTALEARGTGALWWPAERLLAVSDLHLGKAGRTARRGLGLLPPYESAETLARLAAEVAALDPAVVLCLGDSFDDARAAADPDPATREALAAMAAGRRWLWVAGNHDPVPPGLGGEAAGEVTLGPLVFRHEARPGAVAEVSGHFHPKAVLRHRGARIARPCFLTGAGRLILPAFGTYTGGLSARDAVFDALVGRGARAILTGPRPVGLPRGVLA